jgi:ribosomal protein S18 acetylase RimI-like enzyme
MKTFNRPYDDGRGDFEKMWRLLRQDYADRGDNFVWTFARLGDWKYGLWNEMKQLPTFCQDHAQLWVNGFDDLLGFVISEDGHNIFFICTRLRYDYLYAAILDWTIERWGPRWPTLKTEVHEFQPDALAELERRGFRLASEVATTRAYDLADKAREPVVLPPGYRIVNMVENTDERGKSLLYRNAYQGRNDMTESEFQRGLYAHNNPAHEAEFDLSVLSPEGMHVAACVGFNDPDQGMAEVEKVCTHSRYRRLGLGEAVIRACFHRLHARGIKRAYITGYSGEANGLYEKLGPCARRQWFHYELAQ